MVLVMLCVLLVVVVPHWFLVLSPWVFNWTPSHMWGRLYLPMFLLSVGLFTLIKVDSFSVLAKSCPILSTKFKLSSFGDVG